MGNEPTPMDMLMEEMDRHSADLQDSLDNLTVRIQGLREEQDDINRDIADMRVARELFLKMSSESHDVFNAVMRVIAKGRQQ